ncbi:IS630 family transposase [Geodermatophilus obscurus]|uniref:Transposase n=1 Tax=Geodermatophilus obscurus (strain ATCC 25078 / DSM 43160 / JCM 3152 / CCUG 61914 / KCC A-0152 / KCTC 9177 / NBRC 13315 / NRRL B-3577 / G-20) TaxID=526225 RepID=D2S5H0_GEOOG|nr:IS630 family transposase [Geodermatophilus obscurus]ADB75250.1 transposase [Geodermatophilus obscurus DSM 43160]
MREDDGRKLDHQTLEALRLRAAEEVARGVPAAQVGAGLAALGLHRRTIYTWLAAERRGGRQALWAKPVPGRPRKLSDAQLGQLATLVTGTDPRDHGFAVALWTREIVRQLIYQRFGVALTVASVGRTLHALGFSAQRPLYRAEQADPAAVARWKEVEYPAIAAAAKAAGGTVFFIDEAGVRSDYHAGTTWAPVGRTPAVPVTGARFGLNMISAISAKGALRFAVLSGTLTATGSIAFLKRLRHDAERTGVGPVFCVVDNHPAHRAKAVDRYVASTGGALRLYRLPAYSPQLNPDEWVWKNVKHDGVAPAAPKGREQMKAVVAARLRRLQRLPQIVRGFGDPELAYITAAV